MLTHELLAAWVSATFGAGRISDGRSVFWVDHDSGPTVVVKATGAAWHLGGEPASRAPFGMPSAAVFQRVLRAAGFDPDRPHDIVPLTPPPPLPPAATEPVDRDTVVRWIRGRFDWRHVEDRVSDIGWAYRINTQSDAYLDTGDVRYALVGSGGIIVVKRTRGAWRLGSAPPYGEAAEAASEADFYRILGGTFAGFDPDRP